MDKLKDIHNALVLIAIQLVMIATLLGYIASAIDHLK